MGTRERQRFQLGRIVATPGALEVMARYCLKATRRAGNFHHESPLPDFPPGVGAATVWLTLR